MHMPENNLSTMPLRDDSGKKNTHDLGGLMLTKTNHKDIRKTITPCSSLVFHVSRTAGMLCWLRPSIHSDPLVRDNSSFLRTKWGRDYSEEIWSNFCV